MPITVIAQLTINKAAPDKLAAHFKVTTPLLTLGGARIVTRFDVQEVVMGRGGAKTVVVVEYPDRAAVSRLFNSPEYKSIQTLRDEAVHRINSPAGDLPALRSDFQPAMYRHWAWLAVPLDLYR